MSQGCVAGPDTIGYQQGRTVLDQIMQLHPSLLSALLPVVLTGCIAIPLPAGQTSPAPASFGPAPTASICPPGADATAYETRVLTLINDFRARNGMGPLRRSAKLSAVAQAHACDNAARSSFSHEGSDGSDLTIRLGRAGYAFRRAGENTGLGFAGSPDRMMAFWQGSAKHRANLLLDGISEAGLGVTQGDRPAWVLVLANPR